MQTIFYTFDRINIYTYIYLHKCDIIDINYIVEKNNVFQYSIFINKDNSILKCNFLS